MTAPVLLAEAKLFLRVEHAAEDGLIQTLIDAARARVEGDVGLTLSSTSPAAATGGSSRARRSAGGRS